MVKDESSADRDWYVRQAIADYLRKLEGRLKTFVEATTGDTTQSEARKSLIGQMVWEGSEHMFNRVADYILRPIEEAEE